MSASRQVGARLRPSLNRYALPVLLILALTARGDDDDDKTRPGAASGLPSLDPEQQRAAALRVAHAVAAKAPERLAAIASVLDATELLSDASELAVAKVAEHAASAELERLRGLYNGGAGASLRMLEAAETEKAKSEAAAKLASARFAERWGPVAALATADRQRLIEASADGRTLLVRADLPGRHSLGAVPQKALLEVDGLLLPGRVLGVLRVSSELQSTGLLLAVEHAPAGLGPGARLPVSLLTGERSGLVLPRGAVLYDEQGAYVYKQLSAKSPDRNAHYAPVKVTLLEPYGDGWLATGIDADDNIVVDGASLLWSLQGVGTHALDDDED